MIPKRVVLENFLSHGDPATDLRFADDEPLWVLCGPNGVGKSAVFDAMTYALFGCHRGGKGQGMEELIRHGTNGFKVVFEFEFDKSDYRITRTYNRRGRTTQKVDRRTGSGLDDWQSVPNVNSVADVKAWTEQTLGLGFEAFTASVLLRQGEADEIITADGAKRLGLLKKIIGVERFEAISERVHDAARRCQGSLEDLKGKKDGLIAVTPEELAAANDASRQAEDDRTAANDLATAAGKRVTASKQWVGLEKRRESLEKQIRESKARAEHESQIRADKTRLDELAAVPTLKQLVQLRSTLDTANSRFDSLRREEEHLREAKRLRDESKSDGSLVKTADAIADLQKKLASFPSDLADLLTEARQQFTDAEGKVTKAGKTKAGAEALLKNATSQRSQFDKVGVGVQCSRCGQMVNAEHAERERERLDAEIEALTRSFDDADGQEATAIDAKNKAADERDRLAGLADDHRIKAEQLTAQQQILADVGGTVDVDALRRQLDKKTKDADVRKRHAADEANARHGPDEAKYIEVGWERLDDRVVELGKKIRTAERTLGADQGRSDTLVSHLTPDWQSKLDGLDAPSVEELDIERVRLNQSGVATQFQQLQQDILLQGEWADQFSTVVSEIGEIAVDDRIPTTDAAKAEQILIAAARKADAARDAAKGTADDLARRATEYSQLTSEIAEAELKSDLHRKLDDLLGKTGLQRELVRTAEREIVHLANDTVQKLSDGDLSIELDDAPDSGDKAFSLRVRQADLPVPTSVYMLSGSQKFRVAVAVALAIGRYAAGRARPLESVIIDEGFGSLDKEGLRAMADELNQLQQTQSLRRIVLVSHQEEFASRFPVRYEVAHGENGTTATPIRQ